jgi:hypothetical protein
MLQNQCKNLVALLVKGLWLEEREAWGSKEEQSGECGGRQVFLRGRGRQT